MFSQKVGAEVMLHRLGRRLRRDRAVLAAVAVEHREDVVALVEGDGELGVLVLLGARAVAALVRVLEELELV